MAKPFQIDIDKVSIAGRVYSAEPERRGPAVILCHEFGSSMLSTSRYARRLCRHGYHVFVFDFPGSGVGRSRGRDSAQASLLTELADLTEVFDYVRTRPSVDKDHVVLAGASQGGLVAALYAAQHADDVEKLVLYYPALNIPDDSRQGNMLGKRIDPTHVPSEFRVIGYVRLGPRYVTDAQSLDPWQDIQGYEGPVLICHGTHDRIVSIKYARKAAQVYPHATLVELPQAHHVFAMPWTVHRAVDITLDFLGQDSRS